MTTAIKPAVLINKYPVYDIAGNTLQQIRLRFICGHEEEWFSLDLGHMGGYKWKPMTDRQLTNEHLRTTCPIGYKLCRACLEASQPQFDPALNPALDNRGHFRPTGWEKA